MVFIFIIITCSINIIFQYYWNSHIAKAGGIHLNDIHIIYIWHHFMIAIWYSYVVCTSISNIPFWHGCHVVAIWIFMNINKLNGKLTFNQYFIIMLLKHLFYANKFNKCDKYWFRLIAKTGGIHVAEIWFKPYGDTT